MPTLMVMLMMRTVTIIWLVMMICYGFTMMTKSSDKTHDKVSITEGRGEQGRYSWNMKKIYNEYDEYMKICKQLTNSFYLKFIVKGA